MQLCRFVAFLATLGKMLNDMTVADLVINLGKLCVHTLIVF